MSPVHTDLGPARNGWYTGQKHPEYQQLVLGDGDVRLTQNGHYREVAERDFTAPSELRWTSVLRRLSDHHVFVGRGPTNDAAYRAARIVAGDPL